MRANVRKLEVHSRFKIRKASNSQSLELTIFQARTAIIIGTGIVKLRKLQFHQKQSNSNLGESLRANGKEA